MMKVIKLYERIHPNGGQFYIESIDARGFGGNITIQINRADCERDKGSK